MDMRCAASKQKINWMQFCFILPQNVMSNYIEIEPEYLSQYSVWLRAGRPDDRGSISGRGKGFFLYPLCRDWFWGPPCLLYNGYRGGPFPGAKARPERDAAHSPPFRAEVENE
jgi:hypothetical protein